MLSNLGSCKRYLFCVLTGIFLVGVKCTNRSHYDIYDQFPIGSELSDTILKKSDQVIPHNKDVIIVYDLSPNWDEFWPHLLFYDSSRHLYAGAFFPSKKIDSIKLDLISGVNVTNRKKNLSLFHVKIPDKYKINLTDVSATKGGLNQSNKILKKAELTGDGEKVRLYINKSSNIYLGVGYQRSHSTDSAFFSQFILPDTIVYPITELSFNYRKGVVEREFIDSHKVIREEIWVADRTVLLNLFHEIIKPR